MEEFLGKLDGENQEGILLLGGSSGELSASWTDSWHMRGELMHCRGELTSKGEAVLRGSYKVEGHPDWGWRIDLRRSEEELHLLMYNVTPDGQEMLGVKAVYLPSGESKSPA